MEKRIERGVKLKMGAGEGGKSEMFRSVTSAIIPVEDVAPLFRCGRCLEAPLKPPVHTCRRGHLTCSSCHQITDCGKCFKCHELLEGRNCVLEEVLRNLPMQTCMAINDCGSSVRQSLSDQSLQLQLQDPAMLEQLERARLEAERQSLRRLDSTSSLVVLKTPYRPVLCPYPCGRIVTYTGIFPHFEMQHPHIRVATTRPEATALVDVSYQDVVATEVRCQAFLVVRLDDVCDNNVEYTAADMLKITKSSQELRNKIIISTLSVGRLKHPTLKGENNWFLTAWGTCLHDLSPVTYTLSASNVFSHHSTSFTGPLVSLHKSQRPKDVCDRGECLLISPGLLREMKFNSGNPLRLAITFHSDLQLDCDRAFSDDRE